MAISDPVKIYDEVDYVGALLVSGRKSRAGWAERQKQRHAQNGNTEQLLHSESVEMLDQ